MNKIFPSNGKWHTVFEEKDQITIDGKQIRKKDQTSGHSLKKLFVVVILSISFLLCLDPTRFMVMEWEVKLFPPVDLNGRPVTLEVSSSQSDTNTSPDQQISISLIDFDSKITLRDVTFSIKAERGEKILFDKELKAENGFVVFNFVSEETDSIIVEESKDDSFFGSLLGLDSRMIHVKGPNLSDGGLYKFDISIITADGFSDKLEELYSSMQESLLLKQQRTR